MTHSWEKRLITLQLRPEQARGCKDQYEDTADIKFGYCTSLLFLQKKSLQKKMSIPSKSTRVPLVIPLYVWLMMMW